MRTYNVSFHTKDSVISYFNIFADSIKAARSLAQMHKRREFSGQRLVTRVKFVKAN